MITGLNHITLAVSNLNTSMDFYCGVLGFKGEVKWDSGAYLSIGSLWLCLSLDKPCGKEDYTHIAFSISNEAFDNYVEKLRYKGIIEWKENRSQGHSMYILDPDGHKLEIHTGSLNERLQSLKQDPYNGLEWL
ncbi:fosfomycin resistance glutathione transferase [Marinomonas sp. 2405UD68-3]|uniref:fosfomycin resistance glutathione transferase n=1 Tax=Marinomonas sp. 2405UD68-3 TaxID=3391835 RepID=UPI0039C9B889